MHCITFLATIYPPHWPLYDYHEQLARQVPYMKQYMTPHTEWSMAPPTASYASASLLWFTVSSLTHLYHIVVFLIFMEYVNLTHTPSARRHSNCTTWSPLKQLHYQTIRPKQMLAPILLACVKMASRCTQLRGYARDWEMTATFPPQQINMFLAQYLALAHWLKAPIGLVQLTHVAGFLSNNNLAFGIPCLI